MDLQVEEVPDPAPGPGEVALARLETGKIRPEAIITKILPLEQISGGFEALAQKTKEQIKILIAP